ncbi:MAG: ABC transporter substrate-binding protein [Bacteroidetes bacterium]|nr:ABC transporter substrate-binding protein [Bacteroidota bacterium]
MTEERIINIGHSPDPDDAFMFYGLSSGKVKMENITIHHELQDIQTLNQRALNGELDVTAISAHAYPYVADKYWILRTGASMGEGYGPVLISKHYSTLESLRGKTIATPGPLTTANLLFHLFTEEIYCVDIPFDKIMNSVASGEFAGGVLIHEGQITYASEGFTKVVDFGDLWKQRFGNLPLPLGLDVVKKSLGRELAEKISEGLRESIRYGYAHQDEAIPYSLQYGRGIEPALGKKFVSMYVNELTVDMGDRGEKALQTLFSLANEKHILPPAPCFELL